MDRRLHGLSWITKMPVSCMWVLKPTKRDRIEWQCDRLCGNIVHKIHQSKEISHLQWCICSYPDLFLLVDAGSITWTTWQEALRLPESSTMMPRMVLTNFAGLAWKWCRRASWEAHWVSTRMALSQRPSSSMLSNMLQSTPVDPETLCTRSVATWAAQQPDSNPPNRVTHHVMRLTFLTVATMYCCGISFSIRRGLLHVIDTCASCLISRSKSRCCVAWQSWVNYSICQSRDNPIHWDVSGLQTFGTDGRLDFLVELPEYKWWAIELLINGSKAAQHASRFEPGGRYDQIPKTDHVLIDLRPQLDPTRQRLSATRTNWLYIYFSEDYKTAMVRRKDCDDQPIYLKDWEASSVRWLACLSLNYRGEGTWLSFFFLPSCSRIYHVALRVLTCDFFE